MFRNVCPAFVFLCVLASVVAADGSGSRTASLQLRGIVAAQADIQVLTPQPGNSVTAGTPVSEPLSEAASAVPQASADAATPVTTISAATNSQTGCSLSVSCGSRGNDSTGLIVNGEPTEFVDGTIHLATLRRTADGTGDSVSVTLARTGPERETLWLDIVVP